MNTQFAIAYASTLSSLIPLFFVRKKLIDSGVKFIIALVIVSFLSDAIMFLLMKNGIRNLYLAHIYGLMEVILLSTYFVRVLHINHIIFKSVVSIYLVAYIIDSFLITGYDSFNGFLRLLESFLFMAFCLRFYFKLYSKENIFFLEKSMSFWIVTGVFTFFCGAFFSFLLGDIILSSSSSWAFHNMANVLKNVIFAIGFFVGAKNINYQNG